MVSSYAHLGVWMFKRNRTFYPIFLQFPFDKLSLFALSNRLIFDPNHDQKSFFLFLRKTGPDGRRMSRSSSGCRIVCNSLFLSLGWMVYQEN